MPYFINKSGTEDLPSQMKLLSLVDLELGSDARSSQDMAQEQDRDPAQETETE